MIVKLSYFEDLTSSGAITLLQDQTDVCIFDSIFLRCKNIESGGAIRIKSDRGYYCAKRLCGLECNTMKSGNANDFGQFFYIQSQMGTLAMDSLSVARCPVESLSTNNHGPIFFDGSASYECRNTNSSDNYCMLGCGFFIYVVDKFNLTFMNFANDTTYLADYRYKDFWIAVSILAGSGAISYSNFICCSSELRGTETPTGTYSNCGFFQCGSYPIDLIKGSNIIQQLLDISFPIGCAARVAQCTPSRRTELFGIYMICLILNMLDTYCVVIFTLVNNVFT